MHNFDIAHVYIRIWFQPFGYGSDRCKSVCAMCHIFCFVVCVSTTNPSSTVDRSQLDEIWVNIWILIFHLGKNKPINLPCWQPVQRKLLADPLQLSLEQCWRSRRPRIPPSMNVFSGLKTCWKVRSRLYRGRRLQQNIHWYKFTAFLGIYTCCTHLHVANFV